MSHGHTPARHNGRLRYGAGRLGDLVPRLVKPVLRARGFHQAAVLTDWPAIVGVELAACCCPEKLSREGVLHLRVVPGAATRLQHIEPLLLERIASHFGFRAVKRLALRQGPLPRPAASPAAEVALAAGDGTPDPAAPLIDQIDDPFLRRALAALGERIRGRRGDAS